MTQDYTEAVITPRGSEWDIRDPRRPGRTIRALRVRIFIPAQRDQEPKQAKDGQR